MSRSSASCSSSSPAGIPSTIATSPGPCDSPAVVKRKLVMGGEGYRRGSTAGGGAHRVERRLASGPQFERERALLDQHLEAVDGGGAAGRGGGKQWARSL